MFTSENNRYSSGESNLSPNLFEECKRSPEFLSLLLFAALLSNHIVFFFFYVEKSAVSAVAVVCAIKKSK